MTPPRLAIVDSTLREGEQFAGAHFTSQDRLRVVELLDAFGVDVIEMTSPCASAQSMADLRTVMATRPRARVVAHTRCHPDDVRQALDCGVDGVHVLFATSQLLREAGHGRGIAEIISAAREVIAMIQAAGRTVRFSCEDTFRSDLTDLLEVYHAVDRAGVDRVGLADTVGVATPGDVTRIVSAVRAAVGCDIEFHGHNDTGCAIANAHAAVVVGATHIDTTVLGIGERNGITSLSGLIARLATTDPALVAAYRTEMLPATDAAVAEMIGIAIPFNSPITGAGAFTHKAGLHTHAVLNDPRSYEILDPSRFGRERTLLAGTRITGRHAVRHRAAALGIQLDGERLRSVTNEVKRRADFGPLADHELDALLHSAATS